VLGDVSSNNGLYRSIDGGITWTQNLYVDENVNAVLSNGGKVMSFSAPIKDPKTGKILGAWTNRMSWVDVVGALVKEESEKLKDKHITQVFSYLMDPAGNYMVAPEGEISTSETISKLEASVVTANEVSSAVFSGEVLEARSPSLGYASYPSQNWTAKLQIPAHDDQTASNTKVFVISVVLVLLVNLFGFSVVGKLGRMLEEVIERLKKDSNEIRSLSSEVSSASISVSEASTQQASALQETAASIEEMNAMTKKKPFYMNRD